MKKAINQKRVRKWEVAAGACCFVAGILAALVGSLLTASGWILGAELHPWIHAAGTALLVVAIPLILFAGFCLDWAERGQERPLQDPKHTQRGAAALAQIAIIGTIIGVALVAPAALHAQQTIFNVPSTDVLDRGKVYGDERRFTVKSFTGSGHEVLVQIHEEAIGYVERMTRRKLPAESSFWTSQAQRLLSDYLWQEGKVPPTRKLTIKDVDRDELPIAARWQTT